jgi:exosortase H (IPTLxxWG-CTERM-specific)
MIRFVVQFLGLLLGLFLFYLSPWGVEYFSNPVTAAVAKVSSWIMQLFDPTVVAEGIRIYDISKQWGVEIVAGCNGMEAVIILFAAVFAFPATFLQKCAGFLIGFVAIHALNIVRVISLFYIGLWDKNWFEWFHLFIWQALIILDALVVWLLWLRWIGKKRRAMAQLKQAAAA